VFYQLSNGKRHVMPSTDRRLELKVKDIDGSDRLTAGCVCQWVKKELKLFLLLQTLYSVEEFVSS